ncbi:unnamed protein product [Lasius platythorax]|uniref:Uncharacterized protein n=1 Tax=Lasius platythorax TaxID=488582 RepID=A0AAV2PA93_9HYME
MSSQSQSDAEENENTGSNSMCPIVTEEVESVKQELVKEEQIVEDIFGNVVIVNDLVIANKYNGNKSVKY